MEYSGTWKEIWTKKGQEEGSKEDIRIFDGWEKSDTDIEYIAKKIIKILDIKPTDRVLEVGCGAGALAQYMDCDYVGIDFSKPLTEKCMAFWQKSAIFSEANDIPFKDKFFDKCFSFGCFLYFPDEEYVDQVLKEMQRVTKEKIFIGELPIESHNPRHMTYSKDKFVKLGWETMDGWAKPYEQKRFNVYMEVK